MAQFIPSYTRYARINKNVEGINWDLLNEDRKQLHQEPLPYETKEKAKS